MKGKRKKERYLFLDVISGMEANKVSPVKISPSTLLIRFDGEYILR